MCSCIISIHFRAWVQYVKPANTSSASMDAKDETSDNGNKQESFTEVIFPYQKLFHWSDLFVNDWIFNLHQFCER